MKSAIERDLVANEEPLLLCELLDALSGDPISASRPVKTRFSECEMSVEMPSRVCLFEAPLASSMSPAANVDGRFFGERTDSMNGSGLRTTKLADCALESEFAVRKLEFRGTEEVSVLVQICGVLAERNVAGGVFDDNTDDALRERAVPEDFEDDTSPKVRMDFA